jgi:hypothetical protein
LINFVTPATYQKGVYVNQTLPLSDRAKILHFSPLATTTTTIQQRQPPKHHDVMMMKQQAKELLTKLLLFANEKTNDDDIITQSNNNHNNNTLRFHTYKPMVNPLIPMALLQGMALRDGFKTIIRSSSNSLSSSSKHNTTILRISKDSYG